MFYFFQRGPEYVRCEVSGDDESGYAVIVTEPGGHEEVERFPTGEEAHARWLQIQESMKTQGWWGPHGRNR